MDSWEEELRKRTIVYGERLAREQMERTYELSHLDYQALIVVASLQQEFEQLGILDYKRTETPDLLQYGDYYHRLLPGWAPAINHEAFPISVPEPTVETLEVTQFRYHKKLKHLWYAWWRIKVYPMYLAVSHDGREVLYEMGQPYENETVVYETKGI